MRKLSVFATAALLPVVLSVPAFAEDWTMKMTVDNQFAVYFGTNMATNFSAGGGNNWSTTYTINATGRAPTDYLYVATASDQGAAQGFVGQFTNIDRATTIMTGAADFEVFPAGAYLQQLFGQSTPWPASLMPTQIQVDAAISYATTNGLWIPTAKVPNWDNRSAGNVTIWGHRSGIADPAEWIWNNKDARPNPLLGGFNHDEFLVFRINGIPTPGAAAPLALAGLLVAGRRRR